MRTPTAAFIVIPAFRPGNALLDTINDICEEGAAYIVVVDDGSGSAYRHIFDRLQNLSNVRVVRHAVNLGKGAALKTGFNHILVEFPDCQGIVTADADGQHHPDDIRKVAAYLARHPDNCVLGVREFDANTPTRSRLGNEITSGLFRLLHGEAISDTQTGLRGIPRSLAEQLLKLETRGYEFELDMLILTRYIGISIAQVPIRTIYINENVSSHFNPLLDSMRIYFQLIRFAAASAMTAAVDNLIFYFVYAARDDAVVAQVIGRSVALFVNYFLNRHLVFHSTASRGWIWVRFVAVVITSGGVSYALFYSLRANFNWQVMPAKLTAEGILFLFNFAFLRDFVFIQSTASPKATDWSKYYQSVPPTARLTRKYTTRIILGSLAQHNFPATQARILEFGGANSCFLDAIVERFSPAAYHVADTNQYGLDLLKNRQTGNCQLHLHNQDIFQAQLPEKFDLVFSVGLIEHFDANGTAEAVRSHFRHVKPGGLVLISFPRPTILYRIARAFLELAGLWKFPDERPLQPREVLHSVQGQGTVVFSKTLWPLILTQHMIIVRAKAS